MNFDHKSLQIGTAIVISAVILRLFSGNLPNKMAAFFSRPDVTAAMIFVETGRVVRTPQVQATEPAVIQETTEETQPEPVIQTPLSFTSADAQLVQINNLCGLSVDTAKLLQQPLKWDLTQEEPTVLILHTHGSESYAGSSDADTPYRSRQQAKNMIAIGTALKEKLEAAGISVLHDCTLHDYPSYNGSYNNARKQISQYLQQYPSIKLVLDIHRDAMEDSSGKQVGTTLSVSGQTSAQLMMVVGTNAGGLNHPNWQQNMALAVKLHAQLEKLHPGICRAISFRKQRFNQDLSTGAMLIEVGAAGNSMDQAKTAALLLAEGIIALSHGANM